MRRTLTGFCPASQLLRAWRPTTSTMRSTRLVLAPVSAAASGFTAADMEKLRADFDYYSAAPVDGAAALLADASLAAGDVAAEDQPSHAPESRETTKVEPSTARSSRTEAHAESPRESQAHSDVGSRSGPIRIKLRKRSLTATTLENEVPPAVTPSQPTTEAAAASALTSGGISANESNSSGSGSTVSDEPRRKPRIVVRVR